MMAIDSEGPSALDLGLALSRRLAVVLPHSDGSDIREMVEATLTARADTPADALAALAIGEMLLLDLLRSVATHNGKVLPDEYMTPEISLLSTSIRFLQRALVALEASTGMNAESFRGSMPPNLN